MSQAHAANLKDAVLAHLGEIESRLGELDAALASGDADRIELQSQALNLGLSQGLAVFRQAAASGEGLSSEAQRRLTLARTRCLQQRQAVQRVTASVGRTLGTLFPAESDAFGANAGATYSVPGQGLAARAMSAYR